VPQLARTGFHNPGLGRFTHQAHAFDLDLEHYGLHVSGQHHIAAATQHQLGLWPPLRVGQEGAYIGLAAYAHQRMGLGHDVEGVEGTGAGRFSRLTWQDCRPTGIAHFGATQTQPKYAFI
jgi:hypothetical protein